MTFRANARRWSIAVAAFCLVALMISPKGLKSAQAPASQASSATPDISGLWLVHDPGSGDWSSFFDNVPKPAILPEIQKMNDDDNTRVAAGSVVSTGGRGPNCPTGNLPMMMASSPPLNIVESKGEIWIGSEANRGRIIYTDGRAHPDAAGLKALNSGVGHSIGHWEGDTLVVDTIGFPARTCDTRWPVMRVPNGGRAKDTTHLTERFRLINGGKQLSVTFTWEDPTIYLKPHIYSYTYDLIENGLPLEGGNDVTDQDLLKQAQGRGGAPRY